MWRIQTSSKKLTFWKQSHRLNLRGAEVSDQAVINCFHKCGFRNERPDIEVLDQEEKEFASLVKELLSDVFPSDYISFDMEVATSQFPVDLETITRRQESRQKATELIMESKNSQENKHLMEIISDDDSEEIIDTMAIKSISDAL